MKKIMIMLFMMVMASFASPLFALDESPPRVKTFNSTNAGEMIYSKNGLGQVGAAHADRIIDAKVNILHKDSLIYSWGEGIDTKIQGVSGSYKQNDGAPYDMKLGTATGQVWSVGVNYTKSM